MFGMLQEPGTELHICKYAGPYAVIDFGFAHTITHSK